jgi:hypothetical protein
MDLSRLTILGHHLNSVIDSGKFQHVTVEDVYAKIENGTILELLDEVLRGRPFSDFSIEEKAELKDYWERFSNAYAASDIGIERNGLNLLLGYVLEAMKNGMK